MASDISITSPTSSGRDILNRKLVPELSSSQVPFSSHQYQSPSSDVRPTIHRLQCEDIHHRGASSKSKQVQSNANLKINPTTGGISAISKETTITAFGQNNKSAKQPDSKLAVLGGPAVGKSALVVRFITKRFIWEYANLECSYRHCGLVDDEQTCIEILDSSGQVDHQQLQQHEGFLLVYSITDRGSFEEIPRLHSLVAEGRRPPPSSSSQLSLTTASSVGGSGNSTTSFVLVGNKSDLSHERRVTCAEGEQLAAELGCAAFFECSACEGHRHLYDAFYELHRDVLRRRSVSSQLTRRRRSSAHQVIQVINKMFTKING